MHDVEDNRLVSDMRNYPRRYFSLHRATVGLILGSLVVCLVLGTILQYFVQGRHTMLTLSRVDLPLLRVSPFDPCSQIDNGRKLVWGNPSVLPRLAAAWIVLGNTPTTPNNVTPPFVETLFFR